MNGFNPFLKLDSRTPFAHIFCLLPLISDLNRGMPTSFPAYQIAHANCYRLLAQFVVTMTHGVAAGTMLVVSKNRCILQYSPLGFHGLFSIGLRLLAEFRVCNTQSRHCNIKLRFSDILLYWQTTNPSCDQRWQVLNCHVAQRKIMYNCSRPQERLFAVIGGSWRAHLPSA